RELARGADLALRGIRGLEIELYDLASGALPRVRDGQLRTPRIRPQIRIDETRVAQAVPEREADGRADLVVVAIAEVDALAVLGGGLGLGEDRGARDIFIVEGVGLGELARRVRAAREHIGQRRAAA